MGHGEKSVRWPLTWLGLAGFVFVLGYAVAGVCQILVWNPMAAVPGATLDEIHADMARANESLAAPVVLVWAATGALLAAAVLMASLKRSISTRNTAVLYLLLLG